MASIQELESALVNADKAGDVEAARTLAQAIKSQRVVAKPDDPTEGMSGLDKFRAGWGKSVYDIGRGVGAAVTDAFPSAEKMGFATRKDVDESKKRDAALMNTGAGVAGNLGGAIANFAPLAMIPGANTIGGGALIGAGMGAIQPVGEKDSRLQNMAVDSALGGAVPAVIRAGKVAKSALIDPFTDAGKERIVGRVLNRSTEDPQAIAQALRNAKGNTPGFQPTAAQATGDGGLSALERTARATDPAGFSAIDQSQRSALVNALRGVAKTPEERAAAEAAREAATNSLYDKAKKAVVQDDGGLNALMDRPSMKAAAEEAANLAKERGQSFQLSRGSPEKQVPTGILDSSGNPMTNTVPATPSTFSGQSLHDLKMGLDTAIKDPNRGFVEAKRKAALGTKDEYLGWLEDKIPEYGQARQTYADLSKPINQMDVGKELYNRFVPALAEGQIPFKSRADALAEALRNGDSLAQNVTGMKGLKFADVMTPEQIGALQGVRKDSQMKAAAEVAGRGVGSDSVQKMSMSNVIAEAGLPSWVSSVGRVPGGWVKTAGEMLYSKNDDAMRHMLADILKDPQRAAKAMERAGVPPSKIAELLRIGTQGPALASPAIVNAQQQ